MQLDDQQLDQYLKNLEEKRIAVGLESSDAVTLLSIVKQLRSTANGESGNGEVIEVEVTTN